MDNLHSRLSDSALPYSDDHFDIAEDETSRELPPVAVGQDERRMQVRAYNFWASMLDNRSFPTVEQLDPNLPDFGPYSVLLDFTDGIENPGVSFLGAKLGEECGAEGPIRKLSDVPRRSLLSRITDHYMQIIANQAPIERALVDRELLSGEDLAWWNAYHTRVLEVVGPLVDGAAKAWLAEQCRPLDA